MGLEPLAKYTDLVRNFSKANLRVQPNIEYNLRRIQFTVNRQFNKYGCSTLEYRIPTLLNALPEELRGELNINKFKKGLKIHYLNHTD